MPAKSEKRKRAKSPSFPQVKKQKVVQHSQEDLDKCLGMLNNMAESLTTGSSIKTHLLENPDAVLKSAMKEWKEVASDMNMLQLATLYENAEIVDILNKNFQFSYEKTLFSTSSNTSKRSKKAASLKSVSFDDNLPLHLACKMGYLNIIKLLLSTKNLHKMSATLQQKSVVRLQRFMEAHGKSFTSRNDKSKRMTNHWSTKNKQKKSQILAKHKQRKECSSDDFISTFPSEQHSAKSALEICTEAGYKSCCSFVADVMFQNSYCRKIDTSENFSQLHKACYLQAPSYLAMLLREDCHKNKINTLDPTGKHPLLIALKNKDCVEILLRNGASPKNILHKKKSLLLWLITDYNDLDNWGCHFYDDVGKTITPDVLETAELLLKAGAEVNHWEQDLTCCQTPSPFYKCKTVLEEIIIHYIKTKKFLNPNDSLCEFISLMLNHGAATVIYKDTRICDNCSLKTVKKKTNKRNSIQTFVNNVDRTIAHSFLESFDDYYLGLFFNADYGKYSYNVMRMLLEQGTLDCNVVPVNSCNVLQMFFTWVLGTLEPRMQRSFLHLLYLNGADFNSIPKPNTVYREHYVRDDRGFKMLPLVQAFRRPFELEVVANIMDFMSVTVIQKSWSQLEYYKTSRTEANLKSLLENYKVRSLCHICKLVIIGSIGKQTRANILSFHIPELLKLYLLCNAF